MSKTTMLGEAQLTHSSHSVVSVELVEPGNDLPGYVRVTWPLQPTVIDPTKFRDTAAAVVKLFSESHIALARIKAWGQP